MPRRISPLANDLAAIAALTKRDLIRFFRDRSQIAGAIGRPAIWMLLFGTGLRRAFAHELSGGVDLQQWSYAGAIAMTILFGGMFHGVTIVWDREFGMLRAVLVAPISRGSIAIGKTLGGAVVTFLQAVIAALFAPLVRVSMAPAEVLGLGVAMAVLSLAITSVGITLGSRMKTFEGFGVISNFVVLPLYFLSASVFPPEGLPPWMHALVLLNPVTYAVDWMRAAIGQPHLFTTLVDVGVCAAFATAASLTAVVAFRRGAA